MLDDDDDDDDDDGISVSQTLCSRGNLRSDEEVDDSND